MKIYKFYKKDTKVLFATTTVEKLADEFELIYDMHKFEKIVDHISKSEYNLSPMYKNYHKLWYYSCQTKDAKKLNVCMTSRMFDELNKARDNIKYALKSAYITTLRLREVEGFNIDNDFLSALYDVAYNKKYEIDTYKIFIDLYADILNNASTKDSSERTIDASRLLGIYKYNYKDESSIYPDAIISMNIF